MDSKLKSAYDMALIAHGDGQAALARGYTQTARERHRSAALHLLREIRNLRISERGKLQAQAATQLWLAGNYELALRQAELVDPEQLRDSQSWHQFVTDLKDRARPSYSYSLRAVCEGLVQSGNWQAVLDLLIEHPFIYSQSETSLIRAYCLLKLGQPEAALCFLRIAMESAGFILP